MEIFSRLHKNSSHIFNINEKKITKRFFIDNDTFEHEFIGQLITYKHSNADGILKDKYF
jgi:hypothetical protein